MSTVPTAPIVPLLTRDLPGTGGAALHRPQALSSLRTTSLSPDQTSDTAHTLTST